ncbi:response regulator [Pseudodonghicola flavimaris]|uniref:histidine kinase n=1 Tax=Pseudodonghicola flavimaris TaxID=3050036 RepID=A0ABT7F5V8_9RHOB|nr:response regulator [Pseudodonghicola flavimaris]MDK3019962.1 response regulator [Pseudodonghicola flavimaris]
MTEGRLRIWIWSILFLAMVVFVAGRLVVDARTRVTASTLTATAAASAKSWYNHYVLHVDSFSDLLRQTDATGSAPIQRHDAEAFGNVLLYRIFDRNGRLVLSSDHTDGRPEGAGLPGTTTIDHDAIQAVLQGASEVTQINQAWLGRNPADHYSRSVLPIRADGDSGPVIGAAEIFVNISSDRATIYSAFQRFSIMLVAILTLASLIPISALTYAWWRMAVMNRDLARARDAARHAEEIKSRFLANMSHEIRTPMNGIMGMAELLNETHLNEEQRGYASTILGSSSALLTIINDILDFSKIEAGKITIIPEPFDLHNCVQDAADLLFPTGYAKGVELCVDFQKQLPAWVVGDESRLRQCLLNVAGNAMKFTDSGHVTIRVAELSDHRFEISVSDTGIGIPADKLDAIFRDFEQVGSDDTRSRIGTGLGLAITRRLLRLMGGDITVESTPGEGSCFRMILPMELTEPPSRTETRVSALFFEPETLHGKTAILVDDLEINRRILTARLSGFGMQSVAYDSARAALSALRSGKQPLPDIVISDHHMPGMNGVDLLRALRELPGAQNLPFIILSSGDLETLQRELTRGDVEFCLNKPVRTDMLFRSLCRAIRHDPPAQRAPTHAADSAPEPVLPLRVCMAEDNKTNKLIIEKMIGKRVAHIATWSNGQEAVDNYIAEKPDLILMDISMPVKGGLTASEEIRAMERSRGLPASVIVALTAHAMPEDRLRCEAAGMDGFLSKPISKKDLISVLNDTLDRLEQRKSQSSQSSSTSA